jgi:peroxisomal 2,4-dienoyl-CoA reductase
MNFEKSISTQSRLFIYRITSISAKKKMLKTFKPNFLAGKTAFITGGAVGINHVIATSFLKFGASVAIMSRNEKNIEAAIADFPKSTGCPANRVFGKACDVRDFAKVNETVKEAMKAIGPIDILVNGAAGNFLAPIDGLSTNGFKTVLDIDTVGTFNVSKAVYQESLKKRGGSVINISATLHYTGTAWQSHVSAAKAGIDALTRVMAVEWVSFPLNGLHTH